MFQFNFKLQLQSDQTVDCVMYSMATASEDNGYSYQEVCQTADNQIYELQNFDQTISSLSLDTSNSGMIDLEITHANENNGYELEMTEASDIKINIRRNLQTSTIAPPTQINGIKTMVVLRVTDNLGNSPTDDAATISDKLFGTHGDQVNLRTRYNDCSFGQMQFTPGTGHDFVDGVAEITVSGMAAEGAERIAFMNQVIKDAAVKYGIALNDEYDHIVFVYPPGTVKTSGATWHA